MVALESTIVAHGMPFPANLETAEAVERVVREQGATPATIAILAGDVKVGLEPHELQQLAENSHEFSKASRRDLAIAVGLRRSAATTVSGTAVIASGMAGISVFVTGGIGGVHRGVEATMDVSADLADLSRTPVLTVCAGAKSILDIPRTLEVLETNGVTVLGWQVGTRTTHVFTSSSNQIHFHVFRLMGGQVYDTDSPPTPTPTHPSLVCLQLWRRILTRSFRHTHTHTHSQTDEFPAFFTRKSGCPVPHTVNTAAEMARILDANERLGLGSGLVLAIPIPEEHAADGEAIERAIQTALEEADRDGIRARDTTPFLLRRVNELTQGASLRANIALVLNNAKIGAEVAVAYAELRANETQQDLVLMPSLPLHTAVKSQEAVAEPPPRAVVIGGVVMDTVGAAMGGEHGFTPGSSNIGRCLQSLGGVGKNVAECSTRHGVPTLLVSAVGADAAADTIVSMVKAAGLRPDGIVSVPTQRSAAYVAVHGPTGDLVCGIADMDVFDTLTWEHVSSMYGPALDKAAIIACDSNLSTELLADLASYCASKTKPLWFEPVSVSKCCRCIDAGMLRHITYMSPNASELAALASQITLEHHETVDLTTTDVEDVVNAISPQVEILLKAGVKVVLTSVGPHGVVIGTKGHLLSAQEEAVDTRHEQLVSASHYFHIAAEQIDPEKVWKTPPTPDTSVLRSHVPPQPSIYCRN